MTPDSGVGVELRQFISFKERGMKMIKKFLKRAATLGLALSLVVTQLTPLVPLTPKVAEAATRKYHCNTCGQNLTSKGSHTWKTTCGGTMRYHEETCGGHVREESQRCGEPVTMSLEIEEIPVSEGTLQTYWYRGTCSRCGYRNGASNHSHVLRSNGTYSCNGSTTCNYTHLPSYGQPYPESCRGTRGTYYQCDTCGSIYGSNIGTCSKVTSSYYSCNKCGVHGSSGTCTETKSTSCSGPFTTLTGTIIFNASYNGGTTSAENGTCAFDSDYTLPANTATRTGWEFVGWNENSNAKSGQNSVYMSDNKTVYALFKKDLTVTFIDAGS